ncbi:Transposon Ty3-G Gag-Pol polyprotein [Frankliniella fusca]|uniref:Transposon Ty3-G Gag-Pol polyprotein n=1 Tax=Frankliniella fusca TaxID=407009 RepID=A0AAE1HDP8_9NEOP|nr:Transposon Ty3-G Gag-Pol polyprotein [Frankliniella fusca]
MTLVMYHYDPPQECLYDIAAEKTCNIECGHCEPIKDTEDITVNWTRIVPDGVPTEDMMKEQRLDQDIMPILVAVEEGKRPHLNEIVSLSNRTSIPASCSQAATKMKEYYDQTAMVQPFVVGDKVLLYPNARKSGESLKLKALWEGPFKIVSILNDCNARIERDDPPRKRLILLDKEKDPVILREGCPGEEADTRLGSARAQGGQAGGCMRRATEYLKSAPESEMFFLPLDAFLDTVGPTSTDLEPREPTKRAAPDAPPCLAASAARLRSGPLRCPGSPSIVVIVLEALGALLSCRHQGGCLKQASKGLEKYLLQRPAPVNLTVGDLDRLNLSTMVVQPERPNTPCLDLHPEEEFDKAALLASPPYTAATPAFIADLASAPGDALATKKPARVTPPILPGASPTGRSPRPQKIRTA